MTRLQQDSIESWKQEDRKLFAQCFDRAAQGLLKTRKCLVTTPWMVTHTVTKEFASDAKGVVMIFEEAAMIRDINLVLSLFRAAWSSKIVGIVLAGDKEQAESLVLSAKSRTNPFSPQIGKVLINRLLANSFPTVELVEQYRMREEINAFPNKRVYNNKLITASVVKQRPKNEALKEALAAFCGDEPDNMHLFYIAVDGSTCFKSEYNHSRSNLQNAAVITDLVFFLLRRLTKSQFDVSKNMLILTPYRQQVKTINHRLRKSLRDYNAQAESPLTLQELPEVNTVDNVQGDDRYFVVLDLTISASDAWEDIGFVSDDKKVNTAVTRGEEFFWIMATEGLRTGSLITRWRTEKRDDMTGMKSKVPKPYFAGYLDYLSKIGRSRPLAPTGIFRDDLVKHWDRLHKPENPFPVSGTPCCK